MTSTPTEERAVFAAEVAINKKDYMACNAYYLRKFFGLREIILVAILVVAGIMVGALADQMFVLILAAVTLVIMVGVMAFFLITARAGYNLEFEKRGATKWQISFTDEGMCIDTVEEKATFTDNRRYDAIDRVALKKDKAYIYASSAMMYYIKYDDFTEGNFVEFCEYLKSKLDPRQLKMKGKFRWYAEQKNGKRR